MNMARFGNRIFTVLVLGAAAAGMMFSCDNPFEAGMGKKVDIVPPVITLETPRSGAFIKETEIIRGKASDDRQVISVEAGIYDGLGASAQIHWTREGLVYHSGSDAFTWTVDTKTLNNGKDGQVKLRFRATDDNQKSAETEDLIYNIKNNPPEIGVTIPTTQSGGLIYTGTDIRGTVRDSEGIAPGFPKIKIWKSGTKIVPPSWSPGQDPGETGNSRWQTTIVPALGGDESGRVLSFMEFTYPLVNWNVSEGRHESIIGSDGKPVSLDPEDYYYFRIWVKDNDQSGRAKESFYPPPDQEPYKIQLLKPTEYPEIVLRPAASDPWLGNSANQPHSYFDAPIVYKTTHVSGPSFVLRVASRHPDGIANAIVEFKQDGVTADYINPGEGRWSGNTNTDPTLGLVRLRWDSDPAGQINGGSYAGESPDPLTESEYVAGGYRIFTYTCELSKFSSGLKPWQIFVHALSNTNAEYTQNYTAFIDGGPAKISVNSIAGARYSPSDIVNTGDYNYDAFTINENVLVNFSAIDNETKLREEISQGEENPRRQVKYVLFHKDDPNIGLLNSALRKDGGGSNPQGQDLAAINALLHDPANPAQTVPEGGSFIINTVKNDGTEIYPNDQSVSYGTYYLYILAQDMAYNWGHTAQKIIIDQSTDTPELSFPGSNVRKDANGNPNMLNPGGLDIILADDTTRQGGNASRYNILDTNQSIEVRLLDDDGIHTGNGGIQIWLTDYSGGQPGERKPVPYAGLSALLGAKGYIPGIAYRQINLEVSQQVMAAALGQQGQSWLKAGVYRFEIKAGDDPAVKNGRPAKFTGTEDLTSNPQFTSPVKPFYFAVFGENDAPKIDVNELVETANVAAAPGDKKIKNLVNDPHITVQGTVSSRLKIQKLWVQNPSQDPWEPVLDNPSVQPVDGLYTYLWSKTLDLSNPAASQKTIRIRAADRFDDTTIETITVILDQDPPTVNFSSPPNRLAYDIGAGPRTDYVNGVVKFKPGVTEPYGVDEVRWWLAEDSWTPADKTALWNASAGTISQIKRCGTVASDAEVSFDTANTAQFPNGTGYKLYILAKDLAGNISELDGGAAPPVLPMSIRTHQDTDKPVFASFTLGMSDVKALNNLKIGGVAGDDDEFDRTMNQTQLRERVKIRFPTITAPVPPNPAEDSHWGQWREMNDNTIWHDPSYRNIKFSFDVNTLLNSLSPGNSEYDYFKGSSSYNPEGVKYFMVQTRDATGIFSDKNAGAMGQFTLDSQAPVITVKQELQEKSFKQLADVLIAVNAPGNITVNEPNKWPYTDDRVILQYQLGGSDWVNVANTGTIDSPVWNITASDQLAAGTLQEVFDGLADGSYTLYFRTRDLAENTGSGELNFKKDTGGPNTAFVDARRLIIPPDSIWPDNWNNPADGFDWPDTGNTWKTNAKGWNDAFRAIIGDGSAADWTDPSGWPSAAAGMTKDAVIAALRAAVPPSVISAPLQISFNFSDELSNIFDSGDASVPLNYRFDAGPNWTVKQIPNANGNPAGSAASVELPLDSLTDGEHRLDIEISDKVGNTARLYGITFIVDKTAPVFTGDPVTVPASHPGDIRHVFSDPGSGTVFTLSGTAEDATIDKVEFRLDKAAAEDPDHTDSASAGAVSHPFSYPLSRDRFSLLDENTRHTITVTAVDRAGRRTSLAYTFYKDGVKPSADFSNISSKAELDANSQLAPVTLGENPVVRGSAFDANRIRQLESRVTAWDYTANASGGDWSAPGNIQNWNELKTEGELQAHQDVLVNWEKNLGAGFLNLPDGKYKIEIRARDFSYLQGTAADGNPTGGFSTNAESAMTGIFYIDRQAPRITLDDPKAYYKLDSSAGLTFTGKVKDLENSAAPGAANRIVKVRARLDRPLDAGTEAVFTWNAPADNSLVEQDYSITFTGAGVPTPQWPAPAATGAARRQADGPHTLYLEVSDTAGNISLMQKDFILDNTPPGIAFTAPAQYSPITGQVVINGSADDDNLLGNAKFYIGSKTITDVDQLGLWKNPGELQEGGLTIARFEGGYTWTLSFPDVGRFFNTAVAVPGDYYTAIAGLPHTGVASDWDLTARPLYEINVFIRVYDQAGNYHDGSDGSRVFFLDPAGDKPRVSFLNPLETATDAERTMGGEIRLFGSAFDNDYVERVVFRVIEGGTLDQNGKYVDASGTIKTLTGLTWDNKTNARFTQSSEQGWYQAQIAGAKSSQVSWFANINGDRSLDPADGQQPKKYIVEVRAWDISRNQSGAIPGAPVDADLKTLGDPKAASVFISRSAPEFRAKDTERIGNHPSSGPAAEPLQGWPKTDNGAAAKGRFTYKMTVRDETGIQELYWKKSLSGAWQEITKNAPGYDPSASNISAGAGMLAKAEPLPSKLSGNVLVQNKWYMIIEKGGVDWKSLDNNPKADNSLYGRFTVFKSNGSPISSGGGTALEGLEDTGKVYFEWEITVDVNSAEIGFAGKADNYAMQFQARNAAGITGQRGVNLPIDNFSPLGVYTGNASAAGTSYYIQGTALDSGTNTNVAGVQKVLAWVTRSGTIYNKTGSNSAYSGAVAQMDVIADRYKESDTALSTVQYPTEDTALFTISSFSSSGQDKLWYAPWDTSVLADGIVTLNFIITDFAGNASFYRQRLIIKNQPPLIKTLTLATDVHNNIADSAIAYTHTTADILGNGTFPLAGVADPNSAGFTDFYQYGRKLVNGFNVRHKRLAVKVETDGGNAANRRIELSYVLGIQSGKKPSEIIPGNVYTIESPGKTPWESLGAPADYQAGTTFMAANTLAAGAAGGGIDDGRAALLVLPPSPPSSHRLYRYAEQSPVVTFVYKDADFGSGSDQIKEAPNGGAEFVLRIWDGDLGDQLADFARINIRVHNLDTTPPTVQLRDLNPRTEGIESSRAVADQLRPRRINDREKGGLYNGGTYNSPKKMGHIEPRSSTTLSVLEMGDTPPSGADFVKDSVSGRVVLRGYAWDAERVGKISLEIGGSTVSVLKSLIPGGAPVPGDTGLLQRDGTTDQNAAWWDEIDLHGHRVEWAYLWNTETSPVGVIGEVTVTASSRNSNNGAGGNPVHQSVNNSQYNSVTLVRRPFISGFYRGSPYNMAAVRSKQGWFSFYQGENLRARGFNLAAALGGSVSVKFNGVAASTPTVADALTGEDGRFTAAFTVPSGAKRGRISYTAAGVKSSNDIIASNALKAWNKEDYSDEAALWDTTRGAHIWRSDDSSGADGGYFVKGTGTSTANGTASGDGIAHNTDNILFDSAMSVNPFTGVLWAAYAQDDKLARGFLTANTGAASDRKEQSHWIDPIEQTDLHFNPQASNSDAPSSAYIVWNFRGRYQNNSGWDDLGGIYVKAPGGANSSLNMINENYNSDGNLYLVEKGYYNNMGDQFANPRIVTYRHNTNPLYMHVSYHDTKDNSIKYRFLQQGTSANTSGAPHAWINLDGGSDGQDTDQNVDGQSRLRPGSRSTEAGEWSAIDVNSSGWPVIAYWDRANDTVKLAVSNTMIPKNGTHWQVQDVFGPADPNRNSVGQYVTMKIDQKNNNKIHIAAYRSDGSSLIYTSGTWNGTAYTFGASIVLDEGNAGKWADLSLDKDGNPWIVYMNNSKSGGIGGAKIAFYNAAMFGKPSSDFNGGNTSGWEHLTAAVKYRVYENRLSIENYPVRARYYTGFPAEAGASRNWMAAVSFQSHNSDSSFVQNKIRISYYVKD
jgi:hypothetical protein